MATAAPHVKLLRQLASAKDDYLSGAFDISWDGAKATLYLVFGRPSHAVFESDGAQIEGEAAIDALLAALPRVFVVSDWRRAMSPHETLSITIDELAGPFVRLAGSYADDPVVEESPEWWSASDDSPDLPFGLGDFPLLPGGRPLWLEASPDEVRLAERLSELPPSILILTGAKLRAAAVVSGGDLIDAVWIDSDDHARGETAGMALLGATKGSLAGYALDDPRVAEALTMLWRLPVAVSGVELSWLDPASMLAAFRADGLDRVLVIDAPVRGIALFSRGGLVAVYSETQRSAVASPERLRSLLSQARGRLTVMERKPRPVAAEATTAPASAHDFFEVAPEPAPVDAAVAEPEAAPVADASADAEVAAAPDETMTGEAETVATLGVTTADIQPAGADPSVEPADPSAAAASGETESLSAHDGFDPPPPPPPDEDVPVLADAAPPPPPPEAEAAEPTQKSKRSRWTFRRSRKSRAEKHAVDEALAGIPDLAAAASDPEPETATFEGWSVRQPNATAQPVWARSRDTGDSEPAIADPPSVEAAGATGSDAAPALPVAQPDDDTVRSDASDATASAPVETDPVDTAASTEADAPPAAWLGAEPHPEFTHVTSDSVDQSAINHAGHEFEFVSLDESAPAAGVEAAAGESEPAPAQDADEELDPAAATEAAPEAETTPDEDAAPASDADGSGSSSPEAANPWASASWLDDVVHGSEAEPAIDPDAAEPGEGGATPRPAPALRTPGPWSWPLAEPDEEVRPAAGAPSVPAHSWNDPDTTDESDTSDLEPAAVGASGHDETASAEDGAEAGFFHRDEPVGSQYVDFDEVRDELVQIGIVWLGENNAVQVTALLSSTRSTIDDFVATIDTIRGLHVDGQDPASIQAMAREMHQQAAERLCGA